MRSQCPVQYRLSHKQLQRQAELAHSDPLASCERPQACRDKAQTRLRPAAFVSATILVTEDPIPAYPVVLPRLSAQLLLVFCAQDKFGSTVFAVQQSQYSDCL